MASAIPSTIDSAGRIVIPKVIREAAGLLPGTSLEISVHDGRVEIVVAAREVRVVKRGRVRVAVPVEKSEKLRAATVAEVQRALRDRRE